MSSLNFIRIGLQQLNPAVGGCPCFFVDKCFILIEVPCLVFSKVYLTNGFFYLQVPALAVSLALEKKVSDLYN